MDNATMETAPDRVQVVMPPPPESVNMTFTPDEVNNLYYNLNGRGDLGGAWWVIEQAAFRLRDAGCEMSYLP